MSYHCFGVIDGQQAIKGVVLKYQLPILMSNSKLIKRINRDAKFHGFQDSPLQFPNSTISKMGTFVTKYSVVT